MDAAPAAEPAGSKTAASQSPPPPSSPAEVQLGAEGDIDEEALYAQALTEQAELLGIDPEAEPHLMHIAEMALLTPPPEGWSEERTADGRAYFVRMDGGGREPARADVCAGQGYGDSSSSSSLLYTQALRRDLARIMGDRPAAHLLRPGA